jgi:nucleoside-diphosphate-sugar epimerase
LLAKLEAVGIEAFAADLSNVNDVARLFDAHSPTFVVHCAALSSPWGRYEDFFRANVTATEVLADESLRRGVRRFVHVSTPSIYTERRHKRAIRESDPIPAKKISAYGDTKWLSEVALDRRIEKGLWAIKLRPLNIIGPEDTTVMPRLRRLAERKMIPVFPEGDAETDLTPVENVLQAILLGLIAPEGLRGKAYNVSNGDPLTLPAILTILHSEAGICGRPKKMNPKIAFLAAEAIEWIHHRLLGGKEPKVTVQALSALIYSRSLDVTEARRDLGFRPLGDTSEYLRQRAREAHASRPT